MAHASLRAGRRGVCLVGVLLLAGAFAPAVRAADAPKLPPDLEIVPRDAAGFLHVRAADLWKCGVMADLRRLLKFAGVGNLAHFEKACPVAPGTIDRITFLMVTPQSLSDPFPSVDPEAVSCLVIVHTTRPYARLPLLKALGYREKVYRRQVYHFAEELWSGLYLIDEQTFIVGSEDALLQFLDHGRPSAGPLQPALAMAAGTHHAVLALNPTLLAKENLAQAIPQPLRPLLAAHCATFTLDFAKETQIALHLDFAKEDGAKEGAKALKLGLDMARGALSFPISELEAKLNKAPKEAKLGVGDLPESFGLLVGIGFLREVDTMLKDAAIEQKGTSLRLPTKLSPMYGGNGAFVVMMAGVSVLGRTAQMQFSAVGQAFGGGGGPVRDPNEDHMRKLADAMERYREKHGTYPPSALFDKDGRPVLSWRVALLPYLGEEALFKQFHLDEPWDSLHNKKLIKNLPKSLTTQQPWGMPRGKTSDLVFTGVGTIFEGSKGLKKDAIAPKTILVLQASGPQAVYWTKPADLRVRGNELPSLFGTYGGQVRAILADGTYRTFNLGQEKMIQELVYRKKKGAK